MRELSSAWTFFYKFVFPTIWIGGFAAGTLAMFIAPDSLKGNGDVREVRWIFAGATVVGATLLYRACMRLKKVHLDGNTLIISNYRHRIEVPLRDVEGVSGSLLWNPELVWLRLRYPTLMGTKIVFMPKHRLSFGFSRHPIVSELRALLSDPNTHA